MAPAARAGLVAAAFKALTERPELTRAMPAPTGAMAATVGPEAAAVRPVLAAQVVGPRDGRAAMAPAVPVVRAVMQAPVERVALARLALTEPRRVATVRPAGRAVMPVPVVSEVPAVLAARGLLRARVALVASVGPGGPAAGVAPASTPPG